MAKLDMKKVEQVKAKQTGGSALSAIKGITLNTIKNLDNATQFINSSRKRAGKELLSIAHALLIVNKEKLYKEKYSTQEEYVEKELSIARSTLQEYLRLAKAFPIDTKIELIDAPRKKLLPVTKIKDEGARIEFLKENNLEAMTEKQINQKVNQYLKKENGEEEVVIDSENEKEDKEENSKETKMISDFIITLNKTKKVFKEYTKKNEFSKEDFNNMLESLNTLEQNNKSIKDEINKYI